MVVGTPQYFAPEQARAKPLDGRADIYSLGVTLYRATTGRLPFEGDDWYEIARQHVEEPPPPPRQFAPNMSVEFEEVVLRCLAKAPDDRPATGEQLAEMLDLILAQHRDPTMARTLTVPAQLTPTLVAPVPAVAKPPRRLSAKVLVPSAIGVLAIAVTAWMMASRGFGTSSAAPLTGDSTPPLVIPGPDSTLGGATKSGPDSAILSRDSVHFRLTGPPGAQLTFNGRTVGDSGKWRVDTLKPGDYRVSATLPAVAGCTTATDTQTVHLRAGTRQVSLRPRACGTVEITFRGPRSPPGDPAYSMSSIDGPGARSGVLSVDKPVRLLLPTGHWVLHAGKPKCVSYGPDTLNVTVSDTVRTRFSMICQ
jgi:serine/threonine-protein kinase